MPLSNIEPITTIRQKLLKRVNSAIKEKLDIIAPQEKQLTALMVQQRLKGKPQQTLTVAEQAKLIKVTTMLDKVENIIEQSNILQDSISVETDIAILRQLVNNFLTYLEAQ
jgi:hypothetical protein